MSAVTDVVKQAHLAYVEKVREAREAKEVRSGVIAAARAAGMTIQQLADELGTTYEHASAINDGRD
jgi:hypothetical protein